MNLNKQPPTEQPQNQDSGLVDWFLVDFWPRFGKQTLYAVMAVVVVILGGVWFNNDRLSSQAKENKALGQAYIYLGEEKTDSAEAFLLNFVHASHAKLIQDKANLMLGQIHYNKGRYDEAVKEFGQVDLTNTKQSLIGSGALHGLAACYIQKKDYAHAAENLEKFVSKFGLRTGKPSEKVEGKEVADLSPSVANALWKLTLCYRELKNADKVKVTAEKLVTIYPESKEAFDATRLLAQIP